MVQIYVLISNFPNILEKKTCATRCSATVRNAGVGDGNGSAYIYIYKYRSK